MEAPTTVSIRHGPTYERDVRRASLGPKTQEALDQAWRAIVAAVGANPDHPNVAFAGTAIPKNRSEIYKLRVADPDHSSGKSGGYRLIFWWRRTERELVGLSFIASLKERMYYRPR